MCHAYTALRLSKEPARLREIKAEIVAAADLYVTEFAAIPDSPLWDLSESAKQKHAELLPKLRASLDELRAKPLDWFASWYDWDGNRDKTTAEQGAFVLKYAAPHLLMPSRNTT